MAFSRAMQWLASGRKPEAPRGSRVAQDLTSFFNMPGPTRHDRSGGFSRPDAGAEAAGLRPQQVELEHPVQDCVSEQPNAMCLASRKADSLMRAILVICPRLHMHA